MKRSFALALMTVPWRWTMVIKVLCVDQSPTRNQNILAAAGALSFHFKTHAQSDATRVSLWQM